MEVSIREYREDDNEFLAKCMNGMQEHIASIDMLNRSKHVPEFSGVKWVEFLFNRIKKNGGTIFIAEYDGQKVGCVVGIIKESTEEDALDLFPFKDGRILELFVDPLHRGKRIGSSLVEKMEQYFRDNGCKVSELGCLEANTAAYQLYKKHGYANRNIDMCKKL